MNTTVNLKEKLTRFDEHWAPKIVAAMNDYHIKLVKVKGEFVWHSHPETDELFLVLDGAMTIEMRDGNVKLAAGDLFVVPRGKEHRPVAASECHVLLMEPAGTLNTGNSGGSMTAPNDAWL